MSLDAFLRMSESTSSSGSSGSFVEGRCHHTTAEGMFFTVNTWDGGKYVFGPAPWPKPLKHQHRYIIPGGYGITLYPREFDDIVLPPIGARVLVLFLGPGVDRPWVLGLWS